MQRTFPERAADLQEPCTKAVVRRMLANRRYILEETRYKKDKGRVMVYMLDRWADPALVKIGEYEEGGEANWALIYDEAMACHQRRKAAGTRNDRDWET